MNNNRGLGIVSLLVALLRSSATWSHEAVVAGGDSVAQSEVGSTYSNIPVSVKDDEGLSLPVRDTNRRNILIEEIIVTAQKREENLQDVPLSVQAFSGDQLEVRGVAGPTDLMRIVPGLVLTETIGFTTTYIRGLGTDAWVFADPSVANYVDGIYNPSASTANKDFGPVERIEVLKGPQGTLFGRNAIGGAVNVITKPLSFEHPDSSASVTYEDYGSMRTRASLGLPLMDSLAIGIAGIYNYSESYVDGHIDANKLPKNIEKGVRTKIRWKPSDIFELNLGSSYVSSSGLGSGYVVNTQPSLLAATVGVRAQDPYAGQINEAPLLVLTSEFTAGRPLPTQVGSISKCWPVGREQAPFRVSITMHRQSLWYI